MKNREAWIAGGAAGEQGRLFRIMSAAFVVGICWLSLCPSGLRAHALSPLRM